MRAEVSNAEGSTVYTQPWALRGSGVINLDSTGETYVEDFDSLGATGSGLPVGWAARNGPNINITITESLPTATVASGTYNAGDGFDRTLAVGNTDSAALNALYLWAELTGLNDVLAIVLETRFEAWHGDAAADNPGEASFVVSLQFDSANDGSLNMVAAVNGGVPITTGL